MRFNTLGAMPERSASLLTDHFRAAASSRIRSLMASCKSVGLTLFRAYMYEISVGEAPRKYRTYMHDIIYNSTLKRYNMEKEKSGSGTVPPRSGWNCPQSLIP